MERKEAGIPPGLVRAIGDFVENWRKHERLVSPKTQLENTLNCDSTVRFLDAYSRFSAAESRRLQELLKLSDSQLAPLGDPFCQSWGVNRWLDRAHEESYSDWLAWTFEQLGSSKDLLRCLGLADSPFASRVGRIPPTSVEREVSAEDEKGWEGRVDILVRFPSDAHLLIEVKTAALEQATGKDTLSRCLEWLRKEQPSRDYRQAVLVLTEAPSDPPDGWTVVSWEHIASELRSVAKRLCQRKHRLTLAASILNLVGAIEQNLLNLRLPNAVRTPRLATPRVVAYLERLLERRKHGR